MGDAQRSLAAGDDSGDGVVEARPPQTAMTLPGDGEWDVFVSFRHAEAKAEARLIKAALEERGISCFVSGDCLLYTSPSPRDRG